MKSIQKGKKISADHGIIASFPTEFFGYFGWPTICKQDNNTLLVASSGLRNNHVCPFGRTILCEGSSDGKEWNTPRVINDSPFDDRDAGIINLGKNQLLLSWFTSNISIKIGNKVNTMQDQESAIRWKAGLRAMKSENESLFCGSWVRISGNNGKTWGPPIQVPVSAPHGPILLKNGTILYLGKEFSGNTKEFYSHTGKINAVISKDTGSSWHTLGEIPLFSGTHVTQYHEPHAIELPSGKLLGLIRLQNSASTPTQKLEELGIVPFSLMQTESLDGGKTWSPTEPLGFHGSPPHLLLHSSGTIICVYGYRLSPFGERVMLSHDEGRTWEYDYILRDDGPDTDLGYPSSVELEDGTILTVYYQKEKKSEDKCSLLWTRWHLP
ncbi:MAG: sialidase family protein [Candidatus Ratteibacteria bacterium]|jgi:sialidase-1